MCPRVELGPDQELDLGGQVVDRLITFDHALPRATSLPSSASVAPAKASDTKANSWVTASMA